MSPIIIYTHENNPLYRIVPVVHHKDDDLCQSEEEVSQSRDALVSVVHPREVHHVQTVHPVLKVVHEWNGRPILLSSAGGNLNRQTIMYVARNTEFNSALVNKI